MFSFLKKDKFLIISLFFLALAPRIITVISSNLTLLGDERDYSQLAIQILENKPYQSNYPLGFTNARPPVYPLFIAFVYFFTNRSVLAVKLIQAILGSFICILVFFIAQRIFKDRRISFGSGLICAFYPPLIFITKDLMSEVLYTFLLACSIIFLLKVYDQPNLKNIFYAGFLLGLTALTRVIIVSFVPFLILWFILIYFKKSISLAIKNAVLIIFFMCLTILPWGIRNYFVLKEFVPVCTAGGVTFYNYNSKITLSKIDNPIIFVSEIDLNEEQKKEFFKLSEPQRDKYLYRLGWEFVRSHPKDFLKIRLISLDQFWHLWPKPPSKYKDYIVKDGAVRTPFFEKFAGTYFLYFLKILYHLPYNILFIFMLIGFVILFKERKCIPQSLLLILLLVAMTALHAFHGCERYRNPVDPYVFILGIYGLISVWDKKWKR